MPSRVVASKSGSGNSSSISNDAVASSGNIEIKLYKNAIIWIIIAILVLLFVAYMSSYLTKQYIKKEIVDSGVESYAGLRDLLRKSCFGAVYWTPYPDAPVIQPKQPVIEQQSNAHIDQSQQEKSIFFPGYDKLASNFLIYLCENVSNSNCITTEPMPLPATFSINDVTILRNPNLNANYGYIFFDEKSAITYIVWAGTASPQMWFEDAKAYPVAVPYFQTTNGTNNSAIKMHAGFMEIYNGIRDQLRSALLNHYIPMSVGIVISGHSLGGGLSQISAFDLFGSTSVGGNDILEQFVSAFAAVDNKSIDYKLLLNTFGTAVYTFGSPRCGNIGFAAAYNSSPRINNTSIRVINTEDIVPTVPTSGTMEEYTHVGIPVSFTLNMGTVSKNHIDSYIEIVNITKNNK